MYHLAASSAPVDVTAVIHSAIPFFRANAGAKMSRKVLTHHLTLYPTPEREHTHTRSQMEKIRIPIVPRPLSKQRTQSNNPSLGLNTTDTVTMTR